MRGWINVVSVYPIPGGLKNFQEITVVRIENTSTLVVRDAKGKDWTVNSIHVGVGEEHEFFENGRHLWLPESDPRVLDHLEQDLREELARGPHPELRLQFTAGIRKRRHVLRRNGRRV